MTTAVRRPAVYNCGSIFVSSLASCSTQPPLPAIQAIKVRGYGLRSLALPPADGTALSQMRVVAYIASLVALLVAAAVATPVTFPGAVGDLSVRACGACRVGASFCNVFGRPRLCQPSALSPAPILGLPAVEPALLVLRPGLLSHNLHRPCIYCSGLRSRPLYNCNFLTCVLTFTLAVGKGGMPTMIQAYIEASVEHRPFAL